MKKRILTVIFVITLILMNTTLVANAEQNEPSTESICLPQSVIKLKYGMQKFWIEHAWWTRSLIVSKIVML